MAQRGRIEDEKGKCGRDWMEEPRWQGMTATKVARWRCCRCGCAGEASVGEAREKWGEGEAERGLLLVLASARPAGTTEAPPVRRRRRARATRWVHVVAGRGAAQARVSERGSGRGGGPGQLALVGRIGGARPVFKINWISFLFFNQTALKIPFWTRKTHF
jgi:hypothetical protein